MPKQPDIAPLPDFDAMMAVVTQFETAQAADPRFRDAELGELLRLVPGKRAIIAGNLDGRPVVFRIFTEQDSPTPTLEWNELRRIWPHMKNAPYCVVEPTLFNDDHGVLAVEFCAGTPLLKHIWKSESPKREQHLIPAANWLRRYTEVSETLRENGSEGWLQRAALASKQQPFRRLRRLERGILKELNRLSDAMANTQWRYAISHGDFHPNNLILNGDCLTGIDTGGSGYTPIYKDMARFLAHMGRRGVIPSGQRYLGVDKKGIDAFSDAFNLSQAEQRLILPFMIGCEALLRVENRKMKRGRITRAQDMYTSLLSDLQTVTAP